MLTLRDMDDSQMEAITVLYENDEQLLIAPTGSGKTAVALTVINELGCAKVLKRVLVVAPLLVCDKVWRHECNNWEHLRDLKVGIAAGDERDAVFKRLDRFDVVVINFEMMPWMADNDMFKHFDGILIDEITRLSGGGAWFKSMRRFIKHFKWRVAMTAVPITESFTQLFYIQFFVDAGKALGRNRDKHLRTYFYPTDYKQRDWALLPGSGEKISKLVSQTLHVMPNYKDTLPPLTVINVHVELPKSAMRVYRDMAGKMSAEGVTATSTAGMMGKLAQVAGGWLYSETETIEVHHAKYEMLDTLLYKSGGDPTIVVYQHDEEKRRLEEFYPGMEFLGRKSGDLEYRWNQGKVHLMGMHIRTGSHGLNLQHGGHKMVMLAPVWSQDAMSQIVDRLWRRSQKFPVDVAVIVAMGTIDELILDRLKGKAELYPAFLAHIEKIKAANGSVSDDLKSGLILPFTKKPH